MPVANRLCTMQVLPHHRSKLRVPTEISLLGKGRGPRRGRRMLALPPDAARRRARATSTATRLVCQLCRHLRREPPGETVVVHSSEHHRAVKGAETLRARAA